MTYERSRELVSRGESRLLVVDVQEKLMPSIPVRESLVANCRKLIEAAKLFGVPVSATEQYAKGLGPTVPQLRELLDGAAIPDKVCFSAAECLGWGTAAEHPEGRFQIVVAGIEDGQYRASLQGGTEVPQQLVGLLQHVIDPDHDGHVQRVGPVERIIDLAQDGFDVLELQPRFENG